MNHIKTLLTGVFIVLVMTHIVRAQARSQYNITVTESRVRQYAEIPVVIDYNLSTQSARPHDLIFSWGAATIAGTSQHINDLLAYSDNAIDARSTPVVDLAQQSLSWHLEESASPSGRIKTSFHMRGGFYDDADVDYMLLAGSSGQLRSTYASTKLTYHIEDTPAQRSSYVFDDVIISAVSSSSATIRYTLGQPSVSKVIFGTTQGQLSRSHDNASVVRNKHDTLTSLDPNTRYYVQLVTSHNHKNVYSAIYTFVTASSNKPSRTQLVSSHIYAPNGLDQNFKTTHVNALVGHTYLVEIIPNTASTVTHLYMDSQQTTTYLIPRMKTTGDKRTLYALKIPATPGEYNLYGTVEGAGGLVEEHHIGIIHASAPISITSAGKPVAGARVSIQSTQANGSIQTAYTSQSGSVPFELGTGTYHMTVRAPWYAFAESTETISPGDSYPHISLIKDPYNVYGWITYQRLISQERDSGAPHAAGIVTVVATYGYTVGLLLIALLYISYVAWVGIPVMSIARFIMHQIHRHRHEDAYHRLIAEISRKNQPVVATRVYLVDPRYNRVVDHAYTDHKGVFRFDALTTLQYKVVILLEGAQPYEMHLDDASVTSTGRYQIMIPTSLKISRKRHVVRVWLSHNLARSYISLVMMTLLVSVVTSAVMGVVLGAPLIMLTTANIALYIITRMTLPSEWFIT